MEKVKGFRSINWQFQNSDGNIKCNVTNIVNNIAITMYGARWVLEISGEHFVQYMIFYTVHLKLILINTECKCNQKIILKKFK